MQPCTQYTVSLTALSYNWGFDLSSAAAAATGRTGAVVPGPVTHLVQINRTQHSYTVSWEPPVQNPQCVTGYSHTESAGLASRPGGPAGSGSFTATDLPCGATFTFSIWAESEVGPSEPSTLRDITTDNC